MPRVTDRFRTAAVLQVAKQAGFTIRGFIGFEETMGAGDQICAETITYTYGDLFVMSPVRDLYVTIDNRDGCVTFKGLFGEPGANASTEKVKLIMRVSDDGEIELTRIAALTTEAPTAPSKIWF